MRVTKKKLDSSSAMARWDNPIAEGTYLGKIARTQVCDKEDHLEDECERITFRIDGDEQTCPDGPVLIDVHLRGWILKNFLAIFDNEKLSKINELSDDDDVEVSSEDYKGQKCRVKVGHWEGTDGVERSSVNKLLPLDEDDEEKVERRWKKGKDKDKDKKKDDDEKPRPKKKDDDEKPRPKKKDADEPRSKKPSRDEKEEKAKKPEPDDESQGSAEDDDDIPF